MWSCWRRRPTFLADSAIALKAMSSPSAKRRLLRWVIYGKSSSEGSVNVRWRVRCTAVLEHCREQAGAGSLL